MRKRRRYSSQLAVSGVNTRAMEKSLPFLFKLGLVVLILYSINNFVKKFWTKLSNLGSDFFNGESAPGKNEAEQVANTEKAIADIAVNQGKLRFSPSHYVDVADRLFNSMARCEAFWLPSDRETEYRNHILPAIKGLNYQELRQVIKDFGVRTIGYFGDPMSLLEMLRYVFRKKYPVNDTGFKYLAELHPMFLAAGYSL